MSKDVEKEGEAVDINLSPVSEFWAETFSPDSSGVAGDLHYSHNVDPEPTYTKFSSTTSVLETCLDPNTM